MRNRPSTKISSSLASDDELVLRPRTALYGQDLRERIFLVVARNFIPIIGVTFLGWSAPNLIVTYFVDTLAGMWAIITALTLQFSPGVLTLPFFQRVYNLIGLLAVSLFLVGFMAIPLGIPLLIATQATHWSLEDALADHWFLYGLITVAVLALIGVFRHSLMLQRDPRGGEWLRREFGILFVRWVIVIMIIFNIAFLLGEYGFILLVIGYGMATIVSEIYPERFLAFFDRSRSRGKNP